MHVRVLGAHQLETKTTRLTSFLVDGVLAIDAGSITSSLTMEEQHNLKAVLITHHHFDHTRDLMTLGLNTVTQTTDVYSTAEVLESLAQNLLNGGIYPKFTVATDGHPPSFAFHSVVMEKLVRIENYSVLPVPVPHGPPTVGYQVTDPKGNSIFYTGDTGAGCSQAWPFIGPRVLFIEVTDPNCLEEAAHKSGHLTPRLLEDELREFRGAKGYLPDIYAVHMNPVHERQIKAELEEVAQRLEVSITPAWEDLEVEI